MKQLAVAALLLARLAVAQPSLVKDIRTTGPLDASLWPTEFVVNGSALYFGTPSGSPQQSQLGGLWKPDEPRPAACSFIAARRSRSRRSETASSSPTTKRSGAATAPRRERC